MNETTLRLAHKFPTLALTHTVLLHHRDYCAVIDFPTGKLFINTAANADANIFRLAVRQESRVLA